MNELKLELKNAKYWNELKHVLVHVTVHVTHFKRQELRPASSFTLFCVQVQVHRAPPLSVLQKFKFMASSIVQVSISSSVAMTSTSETQDQDRDLAKEDWQRQP